MRTRAFISKKWLNTVVKTGVIAGSVDITIAFLDAWGRSAVSPSAVLRFIASGLMGQAAFTGGLWVVALGLAMHYLIALWWTLLFFWWYPFIHKWVSSWLWQAFFFGIFIWLVMHLLVMPLTRVPKLNFYGWNAVKGVVILMVAVAVPVAIKARRYHLRRYIAYRRRRHIKDTKT